MPIPATPLGHISIQGAIGAEVWSINFWLRYAATQTTPTPAEANTYAEAIRAEFDAAVWSAGTNPWKAQCSTDTTLARCVVDYYPAGSLAVQGISSGGPVAGSGTADPHPAYVAVVLSLLTALPGRSKRGRLYLPATALSMSGATSQMSVPATTDTWVNNFKTFFSNGALAPVFGADHEQRLVILSKLLGSTEDVTTLRMDSLPDTQHGRSRSLVALHTGQVAFP